MKKNLKKGEIVEFKIKIHFQLILLNSKNKKWKEL